jgi:cell division protein FtsI (penicillin-binding protein 3)
MDSPDHSMHFGAEASAPVFHDLAQQVLEYLGVPHDIEVKSAPAMAKSMAAPGPEEHAPDSNENVEDLFAEVNDLPADDPLRAPKDVEAQPKLASSNSATPHGAPALSLGAPPPRPSPPNSQPFQPPQKDAVPLSSPLVPLAEVKPVAPSKDGAVVVNSTQRVAVPSFVGQPVRRVVEEAGTSGLAVEVLGNGLAREQAPAAGTLVPAGTEVVVRFTR